MDAGKLWQVELESVDVLVVCGGVAALSDMLKAIDGRLRLATIVGRRCRMLDVQMPSLTRYISWKAEHRKYFCSGGFAVMAALITQDSSCRFVVRPHLMDKARWKNQ